ncbi:MAG: hypothetical protein BIFFINMI_03231 [Phycisphaerae bacterium]|nr:hypothetical protein [Phycisphaerae bacterium]
MNTRKLIAIIVIFAAASVGWQILGRTITDRTDRSQTDLTSEVGRLFGPPQTQSAPRLADQPGGYDVATRPPDASRIDVGFDHEIRYKGLIWFSLYTVRFDGTYTVNPAPGGKAVRFSMALPDNANIDNVHVTVDGREEKVTGRKIDRLIAFDAGAAQPAEVRVAYTSKGRDRWCYDPGDNGSGLRNFRLAMTTNFTDVDYPEEGLSPTTAAHDAKTPDGQNGAEAVWEYSQMLPAANHVIGMVMPSRPPAGKLSARISYFAPVSLFFFLTVMITIQLVRNLKIHPMNYLLIAAGFFAFHILLAYLVDHVHIQPAFWIAAGVSVFLVLSYLRLVVGAKAALLYAGLAQMIYLVFFSYAFFFHGWTGLTVTIGAVITLFVIMQLTGRINWEEKFPDLGRSRERYEATFPPPAPAPVTPMPVPPLPRRPAPGPDVQGPEAK